jgi:hypothetical protein
MTAAAQDPLVGVVNAARSITAAGVIVEVADHHVSVHPCPATGNRRVYFCGCEPGVKVVCCEVCDEPLVVMLGESDCGHHADVQELLS